MITDNLKNDNRSSWDKIVIFVEEFPDNASWLAWKNFMRHVLRLAIDDGLNEYFRAGQSVSHIIFSTAEHNGLEVIEPSPPRITLGYEGKYFVALSHANLWFDSSEEKHIISIDTAYPVLKLYLAKLWIKTRPDELPPTAIAPEVSKMDLQKSGEANL